MPRYSRLIISLATLLLAAGASIGSVSSTEAGLLNLLSPAPCTVVVTPKIGTGLVLESILQSDYPDRGSFIEALVKALELNSLTILKPIVDLLSTLTDITFQIYWITNQIVVKNCPPVIVSSLQLLPCVLSVTAEVSVVIPPSYPTATTNNTATAGWGQAKIGAPSVWSSGNAGQNVVVATIDSGVRGTHEALRNNFRGSYGWYDAVSLASTPYDNNGHGTHTMGSIVGANGIGVAPNATWMACKGCSATSCPQSTLLACAQFVLCPTDSSGNNRNCSKAPRVVSNSWGGGRGLTYFQSAINAWSAAGIIPVFANGNSGPDCSTDVSPGDAANVIAVGASDSNDALGSFSSRGPGANGLVKPDLTAPGVSIRSAWNTDDVTYKTYSGTSMAAPQVAGAIALLLSAKPTLGFNDVKAALGNTAVKTGLAPSGGVCGGTSDSQFPNNQFGFGRVNVYSAVQSLAPY
jgi:subtilisin family serine protease